MTLLHLAYALFVAALLTGAAALAEAGLRGAGRPARWVWVVALALSASAPVWGPRVSSRAPSPAPAIEIPVASATDGAVLSAAPTLWARAQARARNAMTRPQPALAWIWWAVALAATTAVGVGLLRLERRAARLPKGHIGGEEVALSEDFGPALVGLRRPRTVLPRWVLGLARREVGLILEHERAHRVAGDGRLLALGLLAVAACPWNPLLWLQFRRLRDAVEMDCDRRLLRGGVSFPAYARVLVLVRLRAAEIGGGAVALVESSSSLERRLKTMRGFRWTRQRVALTGAAALGIAVMACETPAPSPVDVEVVEAAADQPLMVVDGVIVNGGVLSELDPQSIERIEVIKGGAARELYGERASNGVVQIYTKGFEETEVPFGVVEVKEIPVVDGTVTEGVVTGMLRSMKELLHEARERATGGVYDEAPVVEGRLKERPGGGD